MANIKISELPAASAVVDANEFEINEAGTSKKVTAAQISTKVRADVTLGDLGVTATASELNVLDGITVTTAELNILDGVTATASELNVLDGITATTTELNYVDGVTSAIQTQLNSKVGQTASTGSAIIPAGTDAQRDGSPAAGYLRFNSDSDSFEGYDGTAWGALGGSGGLDFIARAEANNDATIVFTNFDASKYDAYVFVFTSVTPATDNVQFRAQTSTDGGATWATGNSDYYYVLLGGSTVAFPAMFLGGNIGSGINENGVSGQFYLYGPHLAKLNRASAHINYINNSGAFTSGVYDYYRASLADIDAIRFLFSSGNVESGIITMYGMRNS